jgi:hypothetical protein
MAQSSELRRFKIAPKMLFDVICRQAGSLSKAILEAVMNSVDAKATRCDITVTRDKVTITDDGQGFRSRKEVEDWFEVFGQPHEASEGKTFGTFRIGRGQGFAYGVNRWRTGRFAMTVDFKRDGDGYELRDGLKAVPGCTIEIELYEPLSLLQIDEVERSLDLWVRYAQIPVTVNGQTVSKSPATDGSWPDSTDDAYIRLDANKAGLSVYNLGVHVCELSNYVMGTGGVVVSKQQLQVNFARNDVQSSCPVWRRIRAVIDQKAGQRRNRHLRLLSLSSTACRFRESERPQSGLVDVRDLRIHSVEQGR